MRLFVSLKEDTLHYVVDDGQSRQEAFLVFDEQRVKGLCRKLFSLAQSLVQTQATSLDAFAQMQTLTRALTCLLVPKAILAELSHASFPIALRVDPKLDFIPWEWLHDGEDFWMRRHFLGRISDRSSSLKPLLDRPIRMLVVVADPDSDLPYAIPEARRLVRELDQGRTFAARLIVNPRVDELIRLFNLHAVVHYIGHTVVTNSPQGPVTAWKLADGTFGPDEISAATFGGAHVRFVFSNACPGAVFEPEFASMLPRTLQVAGVPFVIASLVDVPDRTAVEMSTGFYHDLAIGHRMGDALALARERARTRLGKTDITWMVHTLYGDPKETPFPMRVDDKDITRVRLSGAVPYKPPRSKVIWRSWARKFEVALLLFLAGVTVFQLLRPLLVSQKSFSPVVIPLRSTDVSGRVLFLGFSDTASDAMLEAEQCFIRALVTLTEIRLEDARGMIGLQQNRGHFGLEITGRVVSSAAGGEKVLLWVRRISDRVVVYADDFPLPMHDDTPCVRLQDWIRRHHKWPL